jgi:acetoin:2,6-dichlorophenolindophenol oxidoreductase subunit alpha
VSKSFENPLMPHKKLRQIYTAMVQARLVWKALPASRRDASRTKGMEACLVSASVDLGPGDLVSDALVGGAVDYLRGERLGAVMRPKAARPRKVVADCGAARRLATIPGAAERLWATLGAASALKSIPAPQEADGQGRSKGVVMAYLLQDTLAESELIPILTCAAKQELPIIFVVMPPSLGTAAGEVSQLSLQCGVAGIAVDGDDAVAIYRVAQESIGRARVGGGPALIECIPFITEGSEDSRQDAIAGIERYLLQRGVCTKAWLDGTTRSFAEKVKAAKQP